MLGKAMSHLRRASTTIKTTLLKGAGRGSAPASKTARPGKTGLYGKKPFAKIRIPIGRRILTAAMSSQELTAFIVNSDLTKLVVRGPKTLATPFGYLSFV